MKIFRNLIIILVCLIFHTAQSQDFDGFTMYNGQNSSTTYLIDRNGDIAHTWSLPTNCNYAVLLKDNGNIVRGAVNNSNQINGAAVGGLVQEFDPQGNLVWEFTYSNTDYVSHHDITLVGENVLLTAWEVKSSSELQALGYSDNAQKYPTHFIEVQQNGTGGEIVWEWHMIDHLVQDTDASKPNFGVVTDHPELMDINVPTGGGMGPGGGGGDWFHVNGVDYNPVLDQIAFTSRFLSEVFIIDHSTTTAEAASHSGGNSGKGGDFLFRWGNPSNFGATGDQTITGPCHDARWIPNDGRPRGGFLQFFNNEGDGNISTVDALELPFAADGYNYEWTTGTAYGPATATWRHTCLDNATGQSASNSMPNGNTFVNLSGGYQYEVDLNDNIVWQYSADPPKGFRYVCSHPGIQALIAAGEVDGGLCDIINATNEISKEQLNISPNPSNGLFEITGLADDYQIQAIQIFDLLGKKIRTLGNTTTVDLTQQIAGTYIVSIRLENNQLISKRISVIK
jgi:hypothetical protein